MSVTAPKGFRASGVTAGLKASGNPDLALVVNDGPLDAAAGVFTANRVKAAPVVWSQQVLAGGRVEAVVLNAGGANACTGPAGFADTHHTAEAVAVALGTGAGRVAVCSTGLIGVRLPMDLVLPGVAAAAAALHADGGKDAAEAIRTTDTVAKTATATGEGWSVGGMAKGAAMLSPALATMLAVVTTDAVADSTTLDRVLRAATSGSFDRVDTDGCMSTNDTVLLLASGASGVTPDEADLRQAVSAVCQDLARQMVGDAEGASKDVEVRVVGAASVPDALEAARAVGRSNLLKCAHDTARTPTGDGSWQLSARPRAAFDPDDLAVRHQRRVGLPVRSAAAEDRDAGGPHRSQRSEITVDLARR